MESNSRRRGASRPDRYHHRSHAERAPSELFTASEVARFCQVDLKTIHNWADKGEIRHFRTPGRHLRFRRLEVLEFLRRYGYAIPDELRAVRPRLVLVDTEASSALRRTLGRRFDVSAFHDPLDALMSIAALDPDIIVLDLDVPGFDGVHFLSRLKAHDVTAHIRVFVVSKHAHAREELRAAGAIEVFGKDEATRLRDTLERLTGVDDER